MGRIAIVFGEHGNFLKTSSVPAYYEFAIWQWPCAANSMMPTT
jgi:hypothetical protein